MSSRWNVVLLAVLLISSASWSCSGGGGSSDPGPDTTGPTVTSTNPGSGAGAVAKGVAITATFSEAVDPATVSTTSFTLASAIGAVAGSVSYDAPTRTATLRPSSALVPSTTYTATISGVKDAVGNPMDASHQWSFETATPTSGDLDPTFGVLGIARTSLGGGYFDAAYAMAIQQDDKIVVAGASGGRAAFTLVRYDVDGDLDPTFGPGGIVTTAIGSCGSIARAIAIQPDDGKIVVAGTCAFDVALARYQTDGTLDPTFGTSGTKVLSLSGNEVARAVAVDASGNIVVAGESNLYSSATNYTDFLVARFTPAGDLDSTFSGDGLAFVDFKPSTYTSGSPLSDAAYGVAIQGDGRIVAVGRAENVASLDDVAVARLDSNGTLSGKATYGSGTFCATLCGNSASAVAIQPDGAVVAAGTLDYRYFGVMRFSSLSLDTSFDGAGFVKTDLRNDTSSSEDYAYALTVQPDGKIVVAGTVKTAVGSPYPRDFAVARYLPTGPLDTTFGTGGKVITDAGGVDDVLTGVALQSNGMIVVAGTSAKDFTVARYVP